MFLFIIVSLHKGCGQSGDSSIQSALGPKPLTKVLILSNIQPDTILPSLSSADPSLTTFPSLHILAANSHCRHSELASHLARHECGPSLGASSSSISLLILSQKALSPAVISGATKFRNTSSWRRIVSFYETVSIDFPENYDNTTRLTPYVPLIHFCSYSHMPSIHGGDMWW